MVPSKLLLGYVINGLIRFGRILASFIISPYRISIKEGATRFDQHHIRALVLDIWECRRVFLIRVVELEL